MGRRNESWERTLSGKEEEFVCQNLHRIDTFLKSHTARSLAGKYYTNIKTHQGELASDLYLALRRAAIGCQDYENAFVWYGPVVFSQTTEEYFQTNIRQSDKRRDPSKRRLKDKGKSVLHTQRLAYIESNASAKPFKVLDCTKISHLIRRAGLTKMQIRVFLLIARRDMSLMEISKRIGRSLCTVRTHYYRAINKLKAYVHRAHLETVDVYRDPTKEEIFDLK